MAKTTEDYAPTPEAAQLWLIARLMDMLCARDERDIGGFFQMTREDFPKTIKAAGAEATRTSGQPNAWDQP